MFGRRRPNAPLVLSVIALVVALTGTGFAAAHYIITSSSQVKPGAIKGKNIARKTVRLKNLATDARPRTGPRGSVGPAGPIGLTGPAGNDGAPGPATLPAAIGARALFSSQTRDVPNTSPTSITLGQVAFDTGGFIKPAAADDRMFAPRAGVYTITAGVEWDKTTLASPSATGRISATLLHRSSTDQPTLASVIVPYQNNTYSSQSLAAVARLEEGDSVGIQVYQDSGGTLKVTSIDKQTFLSMVYNGP
jgi:hypothetical protein